MINKITILVIFVALFALSGTAYFVYFTTESKEMNITMSMLSIAKVISVYYSFNDTIPHPLPSSNSYRKPAYSIILSSPNSSSYIFRIYFSKIDLKGEIHNYTTYVKEEYEDCDTIIEEKKKEGYVLSSKQPFYDPNTFNITGYQLLFRKKLNAEDNVTAVGEKFSINCGTVYFKDTVDLNEIYENLEEHVSGDVMVIKDSRGDIIAIIANNTSLYLRGMTFSNRLLMLPPINNEIMFDKYNKIYIEFYTDSEDPSYGVDIEGYEVFLGIE